MEVQLGVVDLRLEPESLRNVTKAQFGILLVLFQKIKTNHFIGKIKLKIIIENTS